MPMASGAKLITASSVSQLASSIVRNSLDATSPYCQKQGDHLAILRLPQFFFFGSSLRLTERPDEENHFYPGERNGSLSTSLSL